MSAYFFPVDAGHVLIFARAVGDTNPAYQRIASTCGRNPGDSAVVPPTFVQASAHYDPGYPLRLPAAASEQSRFQRETAGARRGPILHAEQHFEYRRPVRIGDLFTVTSHSGSVSHKLNRRGGMLEFSERFTEYIAVDGEPAVIARSIGVQTVPTESDEIAGGETATEQGRSEQASSVESPPSHIAPASNPEVERSRTVELGRLSRQRIAMYAGASGDFNRVHIDEEFATGRGGYPSVIAHGMLTMAMTGTVLTDWFGASRLRYYGARFSKPVLPGDLLTATVTLTTVHDDGEFQVAEIDLVTRKPSGEVVLTGNAVVALDGDAGDE
ncbi:MaoC/PaaZ C-terminal domain-containing protein [Nocardia sp. CA-084685]|uniref:MaoC/PaaZ C-terminal domain-containing protein n=1 Tax=Nocardia sp. CA-084685 TaxID=3239970 RepID=UPI003D977E84